MSAIVNQTTLYISGPTQATNGVPLVVQGPPGTSSSSVTLFLSCYPQIGPLNLFIEGFSGEADVGLPLAVVGCGIGTHGQFDGLTLAIPGSIPTLTAGLPLTLLGVTHGSQPSNMNLFVSGNHTSQTNATPLFIKGFDSCPDAWMDFDSLWGESDSDFDCTSCDGWDWEQEDFLWQNDSSPDWDDCTGHGVIANKTMPLFMSSTIVGHTSAGMNLFIKANAAKGLSLFVEGPAGTINNGLHLFVYGSSPKTLGLPLVLPNSKASMTSPGQMLYVNGY